jgi:hypothetical protein
MCVYKGIYPVSCVFFVCVWFFHFFTLQEFNTHTHTHTHTHKSVVYSLDPVGLYFLGIFGMKIEFGSTILHPVLPNLFMRQIINNAQAYCQELLRWWRRRGGMTMLSV